MAGYNDLYSGFFNLPTLLWCSFAGCVGLVMLCIFIGFDSGGFLHRLEERFGIGNADRDPRDDEMV